MNLLLGNDEHLKSELVQIDTGVQRRDLVLPANDHLYTSGTLGRYSAKLGEVVASHTITINPAETAAD
jgi:NADH-quinone oxidoreductase subunit G